MPLYECKHGSRLVVCHVEENPECGSWADAISHLPKKQDSLDKLYARMGVRIEHLANNGQLRSPDHWNKEGLLRSGKHYYAIKVPDIRAYGWFSRKYPRRFIISHYAYKDSKKLTKSNHGRVLNNWRKIEE